MAQLVYSKLTINGKPILEQSNYSVQLHQPIADHQSLEIKFPTDAVENPLNNFASNAKGFIGAKITLQVGVAGNVERVINESSLNFMGVVTHVNINKFDGADGTITIFAQSPTILLAHGKDSQSFENQTLENIINEVTKEYQEDLVKVKVNAKYKETIPYTVQYKEDDFSFLQRLAARYGEWLYYDGEILQFGGAGSGNQELVYGQNLQQFNFGLNTRPQDHTYLAYDALQATTHQNTMAQFRKDVNNPYISHVKDVSGKIYSKKPQSIYNHSLLQNGQSELETVTQLKAGHAMNTVTFSGYSEVPSVKLGGAVAIKGLIPNMAQTEYYGKYIITEITHIINSSGEYENEFKGVPRDIEVPPYYSEEAVPYCEDQYALVVDNNDPQGLTRVRVQFPWQIKNNQVSPWIRVTSPYAGGSKGMHILPEVGEEVLVGFESNCAEKPVVLGTMYNGAAMSGYGTPGNDKKVIHTRSGTKIILNDAEGSVFIEDPSGNTYQMDGQGNINLNAPNDITFTAGKNFNLNVGHNMTTNVGMNKTETVTMNATESTGMMKSTTVGMNANLMVMGNFMEMIQGDLTSETAKGREESASEITVSSNSGKISQFAEAEVQNHSGQKGSNY